MRERLQLTAPLFDVRLAGSVRQEPSGQRTQEVEQAAFARGRREGEAALRGELERLRAEFAHLQNGILQSLRGSVAQVARDCESTLVALALEVARKLVAGAPVELLHVEAAVREVLADLENKTSVRVQLHPEDLALLQAADSPLLQPTSGAEPITFEVSNEVTRGGCLVHSGFGSIDARRETKLEVLRETLLA